MRTMLNFGIRKNPAIMKTQAYWMCSSELIVLKDNFSIVEISEAKKLTDTVNSLETGALEGLVGVHPPGFYKRSMNGERHENIYSGTGGAARFFYPS